MLVSHTKKFIFLKTVKTAGTSVEGLLERFCLPPGVETPSHARPETVSEYGIVGARVQYLKSFKTYFSHMSAAEIKPLLGEDIWSDYFKFSIVRNPYEKAISAFFFEKHWHKQIDYNEEDEAKARSDFSLFVENKKVKSDRGIYTVNGRVSVDHMLRYESLDKDLNDLAIRLDLGVLSSLPSYKSGIRPRFATVEKMVSPKVAAIIESAYEFEFETFGYERLAGSI